MNNTNITDMAIYFKLDEKIVAKIYKEWFLNWLNVANMHYWLEENKLEKEIRTEIDKFIYNK